MHVFPGVANNVKLSEGNKIMLLLASSIHHEKNCMVVRPVHYTIHDTIHVFYKKHLYKEYY